MQDKALEAIKIYAEGGTIRAARDSVGIRAADFYAALRDYPALNDLYQHTQRARADMMVDDALELSMVEGVDPRLARVQSDIKLKIASHYDRRKFGEKIDVTVDQRVSISGALSEARARALRPGRHLRQVQDAVIVPMQQLSDMRPTDNKSDVLAKPRNNPFED